MLSILPKPILSECVCLAAPQGPFGTFKNILSSAHSQGRQQDDTAALGDRASDSGPGLGGQSWSWPLGLKLL